MTDLISRADALTVLSWYTQTDTLGHTPCQLIEALPSADAVERKHGEWIKNEGRFGWYCSECKVDNFYAYAWNSETGKNDLQDRYCPNCGAEMKGEANEQIW